MKPFTKLLVPMVLFLSMVELWAANPSYSSFNPLQFSTNGQRIISIRNGAVITNLFVSGDVNINNTNIFNLFSPLGATNGGTVINPTDTYLPYRSNATTFADSPFNRINTNTIGFFSTNQFLWQPSITTLTIGHRAGEDRFIGNNVTAIGPFAMQNADGANQSVAVGTFALDSSQSQNNVAVGHLAMRDALGANNSVAVGGFALDSVTDGYQNTAVGTETLANNLTGIDNTAIGYLSLDETLGDRNTALGSKAGQTNTTGNGNIFIGYNANGPDQTSTNSIVIGNLGIGNGSNTTVIGNTNTVSAHIIATGYAGAGTAFLSDDGTYKLATFTNVNDGSGLWTNVNNSGFITMVPGQTATNTLNFTSGAADNATNVALNIDTDSLWTDNSATLIALKNDGENALRINYDGSIYGGAHIDDWVSYGSESGIMFVRSIPSGDSGYLHGEWTVLDSGFNNHGIELNVRDSPRTVNLLMYVEGVGVTRLEPTVVSSGTATAYKFDTANYLDTGGDLLATFGSAGTNRVEITPLGGIRSGSRIYDWFSDTPDLMFAQALNADEDIFDGSPMSSMNWGGIVFNNAQNVWSLFQQNYNIGNLASPASEVSWEAQGTNSAGKILLRASLGDEQAYIQSSGTIRTHLRPSVASTGSAVAYEFDTANALASGDSVLLGQTANVTQFRVDGDSGYTGAGTLFLSDDGTYKSAGGGGGGDALWFDVGGFAVLTNTMEGVIIAHDSSVGDDPNIDFDLYSTMDPTFNDYGNFYAVAVTNYAQMALTANAGGVENAAVFMQANANGAAFIRMETQGSVTNGFFVTAPSGYAGAGTKTLTDDGTYKAFPASYGAAASDATTAITTFANKSMFRMPHAMTLTGVRASLATAQSSGSTFTVDIKESGTTVLSTLITIDNTEKTSTTAAVPPVISDAALADDAEITVSVTQVGNGTAIGLVIWLNGSRTP